MGQAFKAMKKCLCEKPNWQICGDNLIASYGVPTWNAESYVRIWLRVQEQFGKKIVETSSLSDKATKDLESRRWFQYPRESVLLGFSHVFQIC